MKSLSRPILILSFIYLLLLGHFLFSNFVHTIGPKFVDESTYKPACSGQVTCFVSCGSEYGAPASLPLTEKGFPVATQYIKYGCTDELMHDDTAAAVNRNYIILVSVLYASAVGLLLCRRKR